MQATFIALQLGLLGLSVFIAETGARMGDPLLAGIGAALAALALMAPEGV